MENFAAGLLAHHLSSLNFLVYKMGIIAADLTSRLLKNQARQKTLEPFKKQKPVSGKERTMVFLER